MHISVRDGDRHDAKEGRTAPWIGLELHRGHLVVARREIADAKLAVLPGLAACRYRE